MKQTAAALQYVHDQKLIHRDVKPENMLLEQNQHILLSDFGIVVVDHSTRSRVLQDKVGTPYYMAPEQIRGQPCSASDQYSLGIVVYEWLCGAYPFDGATDLEIAVKQMNEPPPSLRSHVPAISDDVEWVVLKALAKDPQQRFASVQAFATALEQASRPGLQQVPPSRPTPNAPPRPVLPMQQPTPIKRHPSQRTVLLAGLILLIVGSIILFSFSRATQVTADDGNATATATWADVTATATYPNVAGAYNGSIHNIPANITTSMNLSINQTPGQGSISGFFTVGAELRGTGPFTGKIDSSGNIQFTVQSTQLKDPILFTGTTQSNGSMSGTYCSVDGQNQCVPNEGRGSWNVIRSSS